MYPPPAAGSLYPTWFALLVKLEDDADPMTPWRSSCRDGTEAAIGVTKVNSCDVMRKRRADRDVPITMNELDVKQRIYWETRIKSKMVVWR